MSVLTQEPKLSRSFLPLVVFTWRYARKDPHSEASLPGQSHSSVLQFLHFQHLLQIPISCLPACPSHESRRGVLGRGPSLSGVSGECGDCHVTICNLTA